MSIIGVDAYLLPTFVAYLTILILLDIDKKPIYINRFCMFYSGSKPSSFSLNQSINTINKWQNTSNYTIYCVILFDCCLQMLPTLFFYVIHFIWLHKIEINI
jgi:hypothetical protein